MGAATFLWQKITRKSKTVRDPLFVWLSLFFIISFAANEYYFSILRYLATLEMLAPLFIYLLIEKMLLDKFTRRAIFAACMYAMVMFMIPMVNAREPWYTTSYFDQEIPVVTQKIAQATVLIGYPAFTMTNDPRPQMFLIPFFPPKWRFVGVPFADFKYDAADKIAQNKIANIIRDTTQPIFLLTPVNFKEEFFRIAKRFHLQAAGKCDYLPSHRAVMAQHPVQLCPVKKKG